MITVMMCHRHARTVMPKVEGTALVRESLKNVARRTKSGRLCTGFRRHENSAGGRRDPAGQRKRASETAGTGFSRTAREIKENRAPAIRPNRRLLSSIIQRTRFEQVGERMRKESLNRSADSIVHVCRGKLNRRSCHSVVLPFSMAVGLCVCGSAYAEECLRTPQQLLEKKVSDTWKELHQKDNQPLYLTISAGQGDQLHFEGKKPDGSTWISGALSICANAGNQYQVKVDRIDEAPLLVAQQLTAISGTIPAGSSRLKFGTGKHCGNPDPCIEFAAQ